MDARRPIPPRIQIKTFRAPPPLSRFRPSINYPIQTKVMGKIAAIDYGLKRIGIALSDASKQMAFPLAVVEGGKREIENIEKALGERKWL